MSLHAVFVDHQYPDLHKIEKLNSSAFPIEEQISLSHMLKLTFDPDTTFQMVGLYDNNQFVGFVWYRVEETYLYYAFIAIEEHLRNKGYGHAVFDLMESLYPHRGAIVEMEPCVQDAINYKQRYARLQFYTSNGFLPTPYHVSYYGCTFAVYYKGKPDIIEAFRIMFLSNPGFYPVFTIVEPTKHNQ